MKQRAFIACVLLGAIGCVTGCSTDYYAQMFLKRDTSPGKRDYLLVPSTQKLVDYKDISSGRRVEMPDKVAIDVWVVNAKDKARGTVLVLHDLGWSKNGYRRMASRLAAKGYDVVLPDLRAHGRSDGKYITYGAKEKHDQKRVMDELLAEKIVSEPVYVFGAGLGGAVGLQYAAIEPRVKGVMVLAAFRDVNSAFDMFINEAAMMMSLEDRQKTFARAAKVGKFEPEDASALTAVAKLKCPVYIMHGQVDLKTPKADSEALHKAAAGPRELEIVPLLSRVGVMFFPEANLIQRIEKVISGKVGAAPAKE